MYTTEPAQSCSSAELSVQLEPIERRITVSGELDMAAVPLLADVMARLITLDAGDTTIDVARLRFIDAAGLNCVVGFADQLAAGGAKCTVAGASPRVRHVFEIVELGGLLEAPSSRAPARAARRRSR